MRHEYAARACPLPGPLPRGEGADAAQTAGFGVALSPTLSHGERERRGRAG
ncbi:hypothetical protein [Neisseria lactamica]|uniref:hypothetical protein n=1 Tax=Neisseria lactamica TaxID=486 RepID=UPI001864156F|nr:hypothetical protein [Neisseria lactamica]